MTLTLAAVAVAKVFGLFDPKVWYLLAGGAIWLVTWLVRRYIPGVWAAAVGKVPALAQLWMVVLGALLNAAPQLGQPLWDVVQQAILGAIISPLIANGTHAFLKAMPSQVVPYDGAQRRVEEAVAVRAGSQPPDAPKT